MAKSATLGVGSPNRCRATPRRPRRTPSRVTALADYGLIGRLGRVNRLLGFCFSYPLPFSLADFTFSRAHRHRLSPLSCSQRRWRRLCRARSPSPLSCWYVVAVACSRTPSPSPSPLSLSASSAPLVEVRNECNNKQTLLAVASLFFLFIFLFFYLI